MTDTALSTDQTVREHGVALTDAAAAQGEEPARAGGS